MGLFVASGAGEALTGDQAGCEPRFQSSVSSKPAVPNIFGTRGWFHRRQFFHGRGGEGGDASGSNVSNGEQWGAADEALLTCLPLTSCCVSRFLTGHGPVVVLGPRVGDPCSKL